MQSNIIKDWLNRRGITNDVLALFNIKEHKHPKEGDCIQIPYSDTHSKYRRHPHDDRMPKYFYDYGGKVTLYGADKIDWDKPVLLTEGELDTLVAWSNNIQAVSSTGGALSFQADWTPFFKNTKTYICFDNDEAGAKGMVKVLEQIPDAYVVLIPDQPGVKDITDYVSKGGDLHQLLATARQYKGVKDIKEDMSHREATWRSTTFHKAYLDRHQQVLYKSSYQAPSYRGDDELLRAKSYPIDKLIQFDRRKAACLWHNEATPSLHYYPKTNTVYCFGCGKSADAIDVYKAVHDCDFKTALKELNGKV